MTKWIHKSARVKKYSNDLVYERNRMKLGKRDFQIAL